MEPVHLFDLAAQQARWLAVRQATIATNVSNANTPGFKAQDVKPFEQVLAEAPLRLAATNPGHLTAEIGGVDPQAMSQADAWEVSESGNSVSIEQEMIRAGEVNRSFSLNTGIVKAFHGMLMASIKE